MFAGILSVLFELSAISPLTRVCSNDVWCLVYRDCEAPSGGDQHEATTYISLIRLIIAWVLVDTNQKHGKHRAMYLPHR